MTGTEEQIRTLSLLTIHRDGCEAALSRFNTLNGHGRSEFLRLADAHHVTMRALMALRHEASIKTDDEVGEWAETNSESERQKIENALNALAAVCLALEQAGAPITVIKSLDHWPDLGRDIDLFTTADIRLLCSVLIERFGARVQTRSVGDRFANKWNFAIPGCNKILELHCCRLGQMGEHTDIAMRFAVRRVPLEIQGYTFYVPAPEEQVIAACLQRMYRHLFFRLCDIVDTGSVLSRPEFDWRNLQSIATDAGIWPGVATFVQIVADYISHYRGHSLEVPAHVASSGRFGADRLFVRGQYLRVPVVPCGLHLYTKQLTSTIASGRGRSAVRLAMLPVLASLAAVSYKLTGSNQGVW